MMKFCGRCGHERSSSSSNRTLNFDHCATCKKTTEFVAERVRPAVLRATDEPPVDADAVLRFKLAPERAAFFEANEEETALRWVANGALAAAPCWLPVETDLNLHSGSFRVKFEIEDMGTAQLGVGFGVSFNVGVDWGFFG